MRENTLAPVTPLLIDARAASAMCGVSKATWWAHHSAGRTPMPVKLGRRTLWRADELAAWVAAGLPSRDRWEALRSGKAVRP